MIGKYFKIILFVLVYTVTLESGSSAFEGKRDNVYNAIMGRMLDASVSGDGTIFYVLSEKGIYKTKFFGENWEELEKQSGSGLLRKIASGKNSLYLVSSGGIEVLNVDNERRKLLDQKDLAGIAIFYKKTVEEKMLTWSETSLLLVVNNIVENITPKFIRTPIDSVGWDDGDIILVSRGKVFVSSDHGEKWSKRTFIRGDEYGDVEENEEVTLPPVYIDYSSFFGKSIIITREAIFLKRNKSMSFERVDTRGLPSTSVKYAVQCKGYIFAATDRKVFKYDRNLKSWKMVLQQETSGGDIVFLEVQDNSIWVGGERSICVLRINDDEKSICSIVTEIFGPTVTETQKMAIEYAEVSPEKIKKWREGAKWKALLPKLSVGFSESIDDKSEIYTSATKSYVMIGPKEVDNDWDIDLTWDLSDLVWNDAQTAIDVRSKLMVQLRDEILEDVTRLYFERKKLIARVNEIKRNTEDVKTLRTILFDKMLRLEELTAYLDALTGGKFSSINGDSALLLKNKKGVICQG
ncbi:MAG: hypothetical protein KAI70_05695 [Candidatus Omnitrophica bacterium]|nr:hypothetical protein [Candidatus Omnitrophota bacterium]